MAVMALLCLGVMRKRTELSMGQKFGCCQKELCKLKQLCEALCVSGNAVYAEHCGPFLIHFSRKSPKGVQKGCHSRLLRNSFPFFFLPPCCAGAPGALGRCLCRRIVTFNHETRGGISRTKTGPKICKTPAVPSGSPFRQSLVLLFQPTEVFRFRGAPRGQVLQLHDAKRVRR